eukprot:183792-Prorocentrum_minimum.AAC.1
MSAAREDPATADLRQAVEQLQLQLQQLRDGGGEGPPRACPLRLRPTGRPHRSESRFQVW